MRSLIIASPRIDVAVWMSGAERPCCALEDLCGRRRAGCEAQLARVRWEDCVYEKTRTDHWRHRTGWLVPHRIAVGQGVRGLRRRQAPERAQCVADSALAGSHHAA